MEKGVEMENKKFRGCCTVFVYDDGYIVQPAKESAVLPHGCVVVEDSSTSDSGRATAAVKVRKALHALAITEPAS
jgi:hypothetical protein